jgi:hypothetical protein
MTITQEITLLNATDNTYEDAVTVTDIPQGYFLALVAETPNPPIKELTLKLMNLPQAQGGTNTINTGLFVRQEGETSVKVIVLDESGQQVAENTADYPS